MEESVDKQFHENSYGYRPMKSAAQAIEKVRENCYKYDWVVDMDIANFFDEIDHELMLKEIIRSESTWKYTDIAMEILAERLKVKIRGWIGYYERYSKRILRSVLQSIDNDLKMAKEEA